MRWVFSRVGPWSDLYTLAPMLWRFSLYPTATVLPFECEQASLRGYCPRPSSRTLPGVSLWPRIVAIVLVVSIHARLFLLRLPRAKFVLFVLLPLFILEQDGTARGVLLGPSESRDVFLDAWLYIPRIPVRQRYGEIDGRRSMRTEPSG